MDQVQSGDFEMNLLGWKKRDQAVSEVVSQPGYTIPC
jgi:hypothetical protein